MVEVEQVLTIIGGVSVASFAMKFLVSFYKFFLRPAKDLRKLGKWCVVTGATDGIGKAYAMALAKKGLSVVLISRTESKLVDVKKEIDEKNYPDVEVKYVVCDYSKFDAAAQQKVAAAVEGLDVGVLVNNVGVSYPYPKYFHELSDEQVHNLTEMNVNSTTLMTKMMIGGMAERKRGAVVNIASAAGTITSPLLAQYSAAKGYVEKLSRGMNAEYAKFNVSVQCQVPFYVATKLAKRRRSFDTPTPDEYVAMALSWTGRTSDAVCNPFWLHALLKYAMDVLPSSVVVGQTMAMHLSIRKRGMKKEAAKLAEGKKE